MSLDMYREQILDHYKDPHNKGKIENPEGHFKDSNPLCGDEIEVFLRISDGKIEDVKFQGQGCAISTASASLLTDHVKGKTVQEIKAMTREDLLELVGVPLSAARVKCALLSFKAVKAAVYDYLGEKMDEKIR